MMKPLGNQEKSFLKGAKKLMLRKDNLVIALIVIFALGIRVFFFVETFDQPLWWDEAEYLSTAKHWAFDVPYNVNPQRPPLFSLISALTFAGGFGEGFIKFFYVLLPSIFLVFAVYLLGR